MDLTQLLSLLITGTPFTIRPISSGEGNETKNERKEIRKIGVQNNGRRMSIFRVEFDQLGYLETKRCFQGSIIARTKQ